MIKIILAFLLTSSIYAQDNYMLLSTGIDVRNAIVGSKPTNDKSAIDYQFQFAMVDRNFEVNVGYECFPRINFDKYSIGVGYHIPLYGYILGKQIKTTVIPSIEPSLIGRWGKWGGGIFYNQVSSHLSLGANLAFRWNLNDKVGIEYYFNALPRTDISAMYHKNTIVGSNYFKVFYKINR
jgi:hypothetical protein